MAVCILSCRCMARHTNTMEINHATYHPCSHKVPIHFFKKFVIIWMGLITKMENLSVKDAEAEMYQ